MTQQTSAVDERTDSGTSRRGVLRTIGAGTTLTLFTGLSTASPQGVLGTTYDTLTQQQGPPVTGMVSRSSSGLDGTLQLAGFQIPLSEMEQVETGPRGTRYRTVFTGKQFTKGEKGLTVNIRDHENHLSGYITRPGRGYGRLGFLVVSEGAPIAGNTGALIEPSQKWKQAPISFEIPEQGVPTDSALSRLIDELPTTEQVSGGSN